MKVDPIILLRYHKIKFIQEYKFHPDRKWRFDFAIDPEGYKIAIEIEGGTWNNGAHVRGKGYADNCEKYNQAQILGWKVFRYTSDMLAKNPEQMIIDVKEYIKNHDKYICKLFASMNY